jgi:hypothetical protein
MQRTSIVILALVIAGCASATLIMPQRAQPAEAQRTYYSTSSLDVGARASLCQIDARAVVNAKTPAAAAALNDTNQWEFRLFNVNGCSGLTADYFGTLGTCYSAQNTGISCPTFSIASAGGNSFYLNCCQSNNCYNCATYNVERYACYGGSGVYNGNWELDLFCGTAEAAAKELPMVQQ